MVICPKCGSTSFVFDENNVVCRNCGEAIVCLLQDEDDFDGVGIS